MYQNAIPSKYLTGVYDQISEPVSCGKEFSDDHAHQAESDIYLHITDDRRNGAWQYYFRKRVEPIAPQCVDQLDFTRIYDGKAGVQA